MMQQQRTFTDTINSLLTVGATSQASTKCPICADSGWELYKKTYDGIEYEYAKKCTRCNGNSQAIYQERVKRSGMPTKYNNAIGLADFDTELYSKVAGHDVDLSKQIKGIKSFIEQYIDWEHRGYGLYIYSSTKGSGKSYLASIICNEIMKRYCVPSKYMNASDLLDFAKEDDGINSLKKIKLLVLDDIGAKTVGLEWMTDVLFKLIDYRNSNNLVTIYTSNVQMENLPYGERVADRINEKAMQLSLPEISVRASNGTKDKRQFFKDVGLV